MSAPAGGRPRLRRRKANASGDGASSADGRNWRRRKKKDKPGGELAEMALREHLVELRSRLFKMVLAVAVGAIAGWFLYEPALRLLLHPLNQVCHSHKCSSQVSVTGDRLLLTDPLEGLLLRVRISAYIGLLIGMPVILWQLWRFIAPGLYKNERRYSLLFVFSATILFVAGAAVAYLSLPKGLEFLQDVAGSHFAVGYTADKYLRLIAYMMLIFGASFQFPIILITLEAVGLVQARTLVRQWRWAIVLVAVVAAIITPSSDPFSFFALAVPMWIFYFLSAAIGAYIQRRQRKQAA